ncbi:MAG: Smr/MutS family protein [Legionellales bacterium]
MSDDSMSDEDKALFREHMRSVTPLHKQTKRVNSPAVVLPVQRPKRKPADVAIKNDFYLSDYINDTVLSQSVLSYSCPSLPSKRFRSLKNGQIPWEARLDLHGFNIDEARQALCRFIQLQRHHHLRCVLIIHGKGGQQGAPPIIKNQVNRWLPQFEEVLAYHSALAKDGGNGAVYVLLKKT